MNTTEMSKLSVHKYVHVHVAMPSVLACVLCVFCARERALERLIRRPSRWRSEHVQCMRWSSASTSTGAISSAWKLAPARATIPVPAQLPWRPLASRWPGLICHCAPRAVHEGARGVPRGPAAGLTPPHTRARARASH